MQSIQISEYGSNEVLKSVETPAGEPGPTQVRVRHDAIGLNFIDTYHRSGLYKIETPFTPGMEAAGVVDAIGQNVGRAKVGDRVVYIDKSLGGYADCNIVDETRLIPLPDAISTELAAGITLKGLTAHFLVTDTFPTHNGHWALVHAAAGATGSILVQWLRHIGATVIATAGSEAKVKLAKEYGADFCINYSKHDFANEVQVITDGRGVDVVFDGVGKATLQGSLACLKPRGTMISFGNASGAPDPIDPLSLMNYGSVFFTRPHLNHYTQTPSELLSRASDLFCLVAEGNIKLAIAHRYALSDVSSAHADLEGRKLHGPTILVPNEKFHG